MARRRRAIAGIAGTLLAPLAGRAVDRGRVVSSLLTGSGLIGLGFLVMWVGRADVLVCIVAIVLLDGGVGFAHASNQAQVLSIDPSFRGRLNSAYMFFYFLGAAFGSVLSAFAYSAWGWLGVCAAGFAIGAAMVAIVLARRERIRARVRGGDAPAI